MRRKPDPAFKALIKKQSERQFELAAERAAYEDPTERVANPNGLSEKQKQALIDATALQTTFMTTTSTTPITSPTPVAFTSQAALQVEQAASKSCCQKAMQMCVLL